MTNKEKAFSEINKIIKLIDEQKINHSSIIKKEYNYEFNIILNKNNFKVQVYFGKKGVKTVIQGNTDSQEYKKISNIISATPKFNFDEKRITEPEEYIGSDEAGKGDFFGPLVIAAVYVNKQTKESLKKIGVKDSKKLSDNQINNLADEIKIICKNNFSLVELTPERYNQFYEKFKNLNKLLNWAHSKAIEELLEKTNCQIVITDKFSKKKLDTEENPKNIKINFIQETEAEKYIAVAAASILARNSFNNWFDLMKAKGLNLPKGSSIIVKEKASELFNSNLLINKDEICKLHFKTLKSVSV